MAIAASPTTTALPSNDFLAVLGRLKEAVVALSDVVVQLQAMSGTGAAAGAATIAGGPGQAPQQGCCGGAAGCAMGAAQVGQQLPAAQGGGGGGAPEQSAVQALGQIVEARAASSGSAPQTSVGSAPQTSGGGANAAPEAAPVEAPPAPPSSLGQQMVDEAKQHLGKPYVFAAAGPDSFDCSGLILAVAKKFGIDVPHKASEQAKLGEAVEKENLQPGDLVYFQGEGKDYISHIGMFVGDGKYIHAPRTGDVVKISDLSGSSTYRGARRLG